MRKEKWPLSNSLLESAAYIVEMCNITQYQLPLNNVPTEVMLRKCSVHVQQSAAVGILVKDNENCE